MYQDHYQVQKTSFFNFIGLELVLVGFVYDNVERANQVIFTIDDVLRRGLYAVKFQYFQTRTPDRGCDTCYGNPLRVLQNGLFQRAR